MAQTPDQITNALDRFLDDAFSNLEDAAALDLHRRLFLLFHDRFYKHLRSLKNASTMDRSARTPRTRCCTR